jgi:heme oxygenase
MWRAFLSRVDDGSWSASDEDEMIAGAVATFADFEDWMGEWSARPARALAAT